MTQQNELVVEPFRSLRINTNPVDAVLAVATDATDGAAKPCFVP